MPRTSANGSPYSAFTSAVCRPVVVLQSPMPKTHLPANSAPPDPTPFDARFLTPPAQYEDATDRMPNLQCKMLHLLPTLPPKSHSPPGASAAVPSGGIAWRDSERGEPMAVQPRKLEAVAVSVRIQHNAAGLPDGRMMAVSNRGSRRETP